MKILVTGFDPFGGETVNPSYEAVKLLPDTIAGAQIIKLQVPTRFALSGTVLEAAVNEHRPDAVICVGQAGGRSTITPERVAINLADASIPDNAGDQPVDEPIRKDGAPAYFTSLPVKAMVQKMRAAGIPAALSYTAGSFVCNSLMYTLLYLIDRQYPAMRGGFIHVPYAMEQAVSKPLGTPSMELHQIARGLTLAVEAVVENERDLTVNRVIQARFLEIVLAFFRVRAIIIASSRNRNGTTGSRTGKVRDPVFSSAHKGVPHFIGCCTPFGFSVACFPNGGI